MSTTHKEYFQGLNYTIGNEDPIVEYEALPANAEHVVAVAGSGSRVVPLFAKHPHRVTCIDASREQLLFTELRISSVKELQHNEFIAFWGYPGKSMTPPERRTLFERLDCSTRAKEFALMLFERHDWKPLLYIGAWEQTFKKMSALNTIIMAGKGRQLFNTQTPPEQHTYLQTRFPHRAWSASIFLLGNAVVFNALLYKGRFPQKNIPSSLYTFYKNAFERLLNQGVARTNFFLQLVFFGTLQFPEGLPLECDESIFLNAQRGIRAATIQYVHGDIFTQIKHSPIPIDFVSLSDVPSYLTPPMEQRFLEDLRDSLSPEAIVVNRYYLRIPEHLDDRGYINITNEFMNVIRKERVQMFSFGIYKKSAL